MQGVREGLHVDDSHQPSSAEGNLGGSTVLQEATEGTYGFKPTYRKTWLAKQKAVAQIYGDWKESYAELPRWILGVQSTMEGTVALLKTSPVRVNDDMDDLTVYFHRLFWTFSPYVEAFRHCKPLVSIDEAVAVSRLRSDVRVKDGLLTHISRNQRKVVGHFPSEYLPLKGEGGRALNPWNYSS
ncbi:uncharacterized protein LOC107640149 [Arachis ipaensis]|uniref:uncharacterized protein LOC107640149 n=1 Tax=Arachis ipaensis TaxID=130454 RepID=UPI0007AF2234|nr:uncharacterized protein LOC107640149 [Arachis ipaensis]XP_025651896.1 uncharacterized protein LOC112747903 [Arachis hypogaea]